MRLEYVALRNKIAVLIFYMKHFCALHLFREVQWEGFVFMQFMTLLIPASPNIVDTELLSPEPEYGSVELFPHSYTLYWRGEWNRDYLLLFEELSYCRK